MSIRFSQHQGLNVFSLELEEWSYPIHKHNHFEIIFIEKGTGKHCINNVEFSYKRGDVFLLSPEDEHFFTIDKATSFTFVKFTELLFVEKLDGIQTNKWRETIEKCLNHPEGIPQSIITSNQDKKHLFALMNMLKFETEKTCLYSRQIVLELFGSILIYVARSISYLEKSLPIVLDKETENIHNILVYLRKNLFDKEKVTIANLARVFNISPNYISSYFKKQTGESIQQFVIRSKLKVSKRLLKQSKYTISEIVNKLEFTDVSHFNKLFKKYFEQTPSQFRKG